MYQYKQFLMTNLAFYMYNDDETRIYGYYSETALQFNEYRAAGEP